MDGPNPFCTTRNPQRLLVPTGESSFQGLFFGAVDWTGASSFLRNPVDPVQCLKHPRCGHNVIVSLDKRMKARQTCLGSPLNPVKPLQARETIESTSGACCLDRRRLKHQAEAGKATCGSAQASEKDSRRGSPKLSPRGPPVLGIYAASAGFRVMQKQGDGSTCPVDPFTCMVGNQGNHQVKTERKMAGSLL